MTIMSRIRIFSLIGSLAIAAILFVAEMTENQVMEFPAKTSFVIAGFLVISAALMAWEEVASNASIAAPKSSRGWVNRDVSKEPSSQISQRHAAAHAHRGRPWW
jgi:hypothetical protein